MSLPIPCTTAPTRHGRSVPSISNGSGRLLPQCRRLSRRGFRPTRRRRQTAVTAPRDSRREHPRETRCQVQFHQPRIFSAAAHTGRAGTLWNPDEVKRGATLAVINQTMARQYWPNGDAIGRQFRFATMRDEPPHSAAVGAGIPRSSARRRAQRWAAQPDQARLLRAAR